METLCLDTDTILSFQEQVFQTTDQIRNKYPELAEALKAEKKKKNCYVATAVMGDYDHPYVLILREFRDKRLLATAHGRLFVRIYYQVGPITASMIARSEFLRVLSLRLLIIPATKFAQKALSQRP
jgi:hypothetical protein